MALVTTALQPGPSYSLPLYHNFPGYDLQPIQVVGTQPVWADDDDGTYTVSESYAAQTGGSSSVGTWSEAAARFAPGPLPYLQSLRVHLRLSGTTTDALDQMASVSVWRAVDWDNGVADPEGWAWSAQVPSTPGPFIVPSVTEEGIDLHSDDPYYGPFFRDALQGGGLVVAVKAVNESGFGTTFKAWDATVTTYKVWIDAVHEGVVPTTVDPPQRLYPHRGDGLGHDNARRLYPAPASLQGGQRRGWRGGFL